MNHEAAETPGVITGGFEEKLGVGVEVLAVGIDDMTIGFDYSDAPNLARLLEKPGVDSAWGRRLGEAGFYSGFANLLGRSNAHFRRETSRLFVQAKLAEPGHLVRPVEVGAAVQDLLTRMAVVGIEPYGEPWLTRVDVAVDLRCEPSSGKALIDALGAARLTHGNRVEMIGNPKSTVYFKPAKGRGVLARSYCRNLLTGQGEAFGWIRLEAQTRTPKGARWPLAVVESPEFLHGLWAARYGHGNLSGTVKRIAREVQTVTLADLCKAGQIGYAQMERLSTFLDLERLGIARTTYPPSIYAARKREARDLGFAPNDDGEPMVTSVELDALLAPARVAWSAS